MAVCQYHHSDPGSCLWLACLQCHAMPPQVYDSAKEFKLCGAGLVIAANGQAALEAINPELRSRLQAQGRVDVPSVFYDASGEDCLCRMCPGLVSERSSPVPPAAELAPRSELATCTADRERCRVCTPPRARLLSA